MKIHVGNRVFFGVCLCLAAYVSAGLWQGDHEWDQRPGKYRQTSYWNGRITGSVDFVVSSEEAARANREHRYLGAVGLTASVLLLVATTGLLLGTGPLLVVPVLLFLLPAFVLPGTGVVRITPEAAAAAYAAACAIAYWGLFASVVIIGKVDARLSLQDKVSFVGPPLLVLVTFIALGYYVGFLPGVLSR